MLEKGVFSVIPYKSSMFSPRCACGNLVTQHAAIPTGSATNKPAVDNLLVQVDLPQEKWSVAKHTQTSPTDAYGTIEFQGGGFINKAMVKIFVHAL